MLKKPHIKQKKKGKCFAYCFNIDPYPGISKKHVLTFGKTGNPQMILFQGAIGNAYISLYAPRMQYKDEIILATGVEPKENSKLIYEEVLILNLR